MPLDELLDCDGIRSGRAKLGERLVELTVAVHAHRARRAGGRSGLEDQRESNLLREGAHLGSSGGRGRLRSGHAGLAQRLFHRRLIAAQIGGAHGGARDGARLTGLRRRHLVRLDRRLEAIHPEPPLHPAHGVDEPADVGDVAYLLVVQHPALQLAVELVDAALADADHGGAGGSEPSDEFALIGGKGWFDKDDVHRQPGI
jgi:hypothetical protein